MMNIFERLSIFTLVVSTLTTHVNAGTLRNVEEQRRLIPIHWTPPSPAPTLNPTRIPTNPPTPAPTVEKRCNGAIDSYRRDSCAYPFLTKDQVGSNSCNGKWVCNGNGDENGSSTIGNNSCNGGEESSYG